MRSLKGRIVFIFSTIFVFCFLCMMIARQAIEHFIDSNVEKVYMDMAESVLGSCENVMDNMELLSQQLGFGVINSETIHAINCEQISPYEKITYEDQLRETVRVLTFTNSNIGLVTYDDGEKVLYENFHMNDLETIVSSPAKLYQRGEISCFGPQKSATPANGEYVLMIRRRIHATGESPVYLSIETNFRTLTRILALENPVLFIDGSGKVIYSEIPEMLPIHMDLDDVIDWENNIQGGYKLFTVDSERGFSLGICIDTEEIIKAKISSYAILLAALMAFSLIMGLMAYLLGKTVYRPLNLFEQNLNRLLTDEKSEKPSVYTGIEEYDHLLVKIEEMRGQIKDMLTQIIESQEEKSRLQLEKLRYQINPHFLMNTLNTVHWMAILNSQQEIDDIVQALNRLLFYNLDKDGVNTDLERELSAIHEYLMLQKVRYDFDFKVIRKPENALFPYLSPKFMLQPIVENALNHGYKENMKIEITLVDEGERIIICVKDDGLGIPEEKMRVLEEKVDRISHNTKQLEKNVMGIGLEYVIYTLISFYKKWGEKAYFKIECIKEGGTRVWIDLPKVANEHDRG